MTMTWFNDQRMITMTWLFYRTLPRCTSFILKALSWSVSVILDWLTTCPAQRKLLAKTNKSSTSTATASALSRKTRYGRCIHRLSMFRGFRGFSSLDINNWRTNFLFKNGSCALWPCWMEPPKCLLVAQALFHFFVLGAQALFHRFVLGAFIFATVAENGKSMRSFRLEHVCVMYYLLFLVVKYKHALFF